MSERIRLPSALVALVLALPQTACQSPQDPVTLELRDLPVAEAVTPVPFKLHGFTALAALAPDPACGAPPRFLNTQVGEGQATHMGRVSIVITFCFDATDLLDDGVLSPGESLPYDSGVGTLVAANGDELHLTVSGVVLPSDDPDFAFMFQDPFTFVGGTGRFAGASGGGMTDSRVEQLPDGTDRTDHDWDGTLVLERGKK